MLDRPRPLRRLLIALLALAPAARPAAAQTSPHLRMGNPSAATADPAAKDNYLLDREFFASSYDDARGEPNWVSWRLAAADIGRAPRDDFHADAALPPGLRRVEPGEYTGSGFDRGHMCPHGDRTASAAASLATFAMTNIIPQSHDVNTMAWESLEDYCRDLAQRQGKVCYIVCGPAGTGGTGKSGPKQATPDGVVAVPARCWKVALVLDRDVASARDVTAGTGIRLIAAILPNADGAVGADWAPFRTTVAQVEALTGYTFFGAVDPAVIGPLKARPDDTPIAPAIQLVRGRVEGVAPAPPPLGARPVPDPPAVAALREASRGLTYPSETDASFEAFSWGSDTGALTDARLRTLAGQADAPIVRVDPARFFDRLVAPKPDRGQVDPEAARRFAALLATLRAELTDLQVVRFGDRDVAIYLIGRTRDGKVVGLRTAATET